MRYSLVRESDGIGDSGPMCLILDRESYTPIEGVAYPRVGCGVRVGSFYGRSYERYDWWQTSPVTEILEESEDERGYRTVRFKTRNSVYTWKEIP